LNKQFVAVRYWKQSEYSGPAYTYIAGIPLIAEDEVVAPTAKGDRRAIVVNDNVRAGSIDERIMPLLKTITAKYSPPDAPQTQAEPGRIFTPDEI
jgi:hypothetical protein